MTTTRKPTPDTEADAPTIEPAELEALWQDTQQLVAGIFAEIDWADDEIQQAMKRHPDQADLLWHAFPLLQRPPGMPDTEWLYRAHARELLERLAAGDDTRLGTDAEVCSIASDTSLQAPLHGAATGLYGRCFSRILPDSIDNPWEDTLEHEEALYGQEMDDLERQTRQRVATRWGKDRRLPNDLTCDGRHEPAPAPLTPCRFAKPEQGALL